LRRFPVVKTLPGSGMRYRARRVESLALSVEMFDKGTLYSTSNMSGCAWFWHVPASLGSVLGDAWGGGVDLQDQKARRKIGSKFEIQTDVEGKVAGVFFKWLRQEAIVTY
jgi:hypothetical protein